MKQEDINKLKELCEANGFYFDFDVISETAVVAKPKIEKAEVKPDGVNAKVLIFGFDFNIKAKEKYNEIGYWNVCEFLAKQLEEYLNE